MTVRPPIYVFKHVGTKNPNEDSNDGNVKEDRRRQAMLGCCPAQVLFEQVVEVKPLSDPAKPPRSFADYKPPEPGNGRIIVHRDRVPSGVELIEVSSMADLDRL